MEKSADWEQKTLINELVQGRQLAKQLRIDLNMPSSSHETRQVLVHKILKSYDNALSLLQFNGTVGKPQPTGISELPRSLSGSPDSQDSDGDFKDQENKEASSRKRKNVALRTQKVKVCPGATLEGPLNDGYSWRKYGQKGILTAKHPRAYYRCTHRSVDGCLATKQVQRSDEDPLLFEITYRGRHTCTTHPPPSSLPEKQEPPQIRVHEQVINHSQPKHSQEILFNSRTDLQVKTEDLDSSHQSFSSSFFTSAENYTGSPSMIDNNFMINIFPSYTSSPTSGSNYISVSPTHMNSFEGYQNFHTSESDLTDIVSAASTSTTNAPTVGSDFSFGPMEFESTFTFDNPGFFPKFS